MRMLMAGRRSEANFFITSLIGETISELASFEGGVILRMESGLCAKIKRANSTDIRGEKIASFELQFPKIPNIVTLTFASGRRAVIEI